MATFLEICKSVAEESGTALYSSITTTVGQSGEAGKLVRFVGKAWQDIQNARNAWRWMRGEFLKDAVIGTARYTASGFSIADWADWIGDTPFLLPMSIYDPAIGVADEGTLRQTGFDEWYRLYGRGAQTNNRPTSYATSPAGELCLGAIPDKAYKIRGMYRKTSQILSADADIPNMPVRFHDLIVYEALTLVGGHEENANLYADNQRKAARIMQALERDQLPSVSLASWPLA